MMTNLKINLRPFPVPSMVEYSTDAGRTWGVPSAPCAAPPPPAPGTPGWFSNHVTGTLPVQFLEPEQLRELCQQFVIDAFTQALPQCPPPLLSGMTAEAPPIDLERARMIAALQHVRALSKKKGTKKADWDAAFKEVDDVLLVSES